MQIGETFAAGRPPRAGILSFAYAEFVEFPTGTEPYLSRAKYFTEADALTIQELDKFTFLVKFNRRSVLFRLHKLSQEPPKLFSLRPDEVFVERTFDESGIQFFLLFNTNRNYFSWVLNEEDKVPDIFDAIEKTFCLDGAPVRVLDRFRQGWTQSPRAGSKA